ncbi:hypothetical protein D3C71_1489500 [compost metagenome]
MYTYCTQLIVKSLSGDTRAKLSYPTWTNAWDAGFIQLRMIEGIFTSEELNQYSHLLSNLRDKLHTNIYNYGFLMDAAFVVEDEDNEEVETSLE